MILLVEGFASPNRGGAEGGGVLVRNVATEPPCLICAE